MPKSVIDRIFSCDQLNVFTDHVVEELLFNGSSGSRFYICEYNSARFLVKLCFYKMTSPEIYGPHTKGTTSTTDAEIKILQFLQKHIIETNYSACILEMLDYKVCQGSLAKICKTKSEAPERSLTMTLTKSFYRYLKLTKAGLATDKFALIMLERCDITLSEYLMRFTNSAINFAVLKSILFQIIHVMWVLKTLYPSFRHYDLHDENVMLIFNSQSVFSADKPSFLVYPIGGHEFAVPYFGINPKIIDFGFASLPEIGITNVITLDQDVMFNRVDNEILFLFYNIYYRARPEHANYPEVCALLEALDPTQSYLEYDTTHIRTHLADIPTYEQMLFNSVFDYRVKHIDPSSVYHRFDPVTKVKQ